MPNFTPAAAAALALFGLSACASVSVDKVKEMETGPVAPKKMYVQDFEVSSGVLRVDRSGKALEAFRKAIRKRLTLAIVERANKRLGIPAVGLSGPAPAQAHAWLIGGRFVTVNQGSRALRTIFGLGAGATKVTTEATVYDLSGAKPRPVLKFRTSGGSNAVPGVIFGLVLPNYWLTALDIVGKVGPGLNVDVIRTSREMVAVLSEYMAREGFLSPAKVSRAKKLGQWP